MVNSQEIFKTPMPSSIDVMVGIVGSGSLGAACAKALLLWGSCPDLILNDLDAAKARSLADDLAGGPAVLCTATRIEPGPLHRLAEARIIVLTAGVDDREASATGPGDERRSLLLLLKNTEIYLEIVPVLGRIAPRAVVLVVTDPPDLLADVARIFLPSERVISAGTFLDTLRFRFQIAKRLNAGRSPDSLGISASAVDAQVLGEHGASRVYAWSSARIGPQLVRTLVEQRSLSWREFRDQVETAVRDADREIPEGTASRRQPIGVVTARLVEAILRDEGLIAPVGSYQEDYGVTLSLPSVVGAGGVTSVLRPALDREEAEALRKSAAASKRALDEVRPLVDRHTN